MLPAPDADLVRRDPALPGLATLLNPEGFVAALAGVAPGVALGPAEISYIRYKPATNCLVGYRLMVEGATVDVHAKAFLPGDVAPFRKAATRPTTLGVGGLGRLVVERLSIVVSVFPNDDDLRVLACLHDSSKREAVLREVVPWGPESWEGPIRRLAYKPQRRYVAEVRGAGGARAALKCYTGERYREAEATANAFTSRGAVRIARLLGSSRSHRILAFEWLEGVSLSEKILEPARAALAAAGAGAALAELHAQEPVGLPSLTREEEAASLFAAAAAVGVADPCLAARAEALASRLSDHLRSQPFTERPIHGDFYAQQVLLTRDAVAVLDFDRAARGDPASDLGNCCAHLERDALRGRPDPQQAAVVQDALLSGYAERAALPPRAHLATATAAGLLHLAPEPFRRHEPGWPGRMRAILERAESLCPAPGGWPLPARRPGGRGEQVTDPALPFLDEAFHPDRLRRHLLHPIAGALGARRAHLCAARLVRHKPGSRCLIEYDLAIERDHGPAQRMTVLGKVRARSADAATYRLHAALLRRGFGAASADGISVPEPLALIPELHMWVQRKVPGVPATRLLAGPGGPDLARRLAEAVHKLHRAGVPVERRHGIADELRLLEDRLLRVAAACPEWSARLEHLLALCRTVAARLPEPTWRTIHRDFYPDQVVVDGSRVYLVDLDLSCLGDPALDIGNFSGHLTEQGLRSADDLDALQRCDAAFQERFAELAGGTARETAGGYAALTLARHVFLSTRFPERRRYTECILDLAEARAGAFAGGRRCMAGTWRGSGE